MASNKHVDLKKIENFVESKCILKIYRKIKERKLILEKLKKALKSLMGII